MARLESYPTEHTFFSVLEGTHDAHGTGIRRKGHVLVGNPRSSPVTREGHGVLRLAGPDTDIFCGKGKVWRGDLAGFRGMTHLDSVL